MATRWDLLMAAATATTLPIIVIFFAAQRYFVKGVVMTGLKG
jgi:multiple sugar transport system permease protein